MKTPFRTVVNIFLVILIVLIVVLFATQLGGCAPVEAGEYIRKVQLPDRANDCYVYASGYGVSMWCFGD